MQRVKDSSLVTYTISDKDGKFTLEGRTGDVKLNLFISYVGYKAHAQVININEKDIDLGTVKLKLDNALDAILIKATPPITIKKDTLEFNVSSFKTKKDANVEDLLKVFPGVEVDEQGQITVNGKSVNKILVNGKPFFGDDPTITTRNLTKEIIEKVQITDTKTKSEAFTGEQGDTENKTINLTISEEKNKGVFGRVAAGGGTDERYEYAGMLNFFDNDRRLSVLTGGNNINFPGFSFGGIGRIFTVGAISGLNFGGFGGGQGIVTSNNAGANFTDDIGEKLEISADYFFSNSSSENQTSTERENILIDSRFFTDSESNSISEDNNHDIDLGFDIKIDSTFLINISPSIQFGSSENSVVRSQESFDDQGNRTNASSSTSFSETISNNFENRITLTKRFGDKGAFLRWSFINEIDNVESEDLFNSQIDIGDNTDPEIRNQFTEEDQDLVSFNSNIKYRLPLIAKELFLDFEYRFSNNNRSRVESTFDFDEVTQDFTIFNDSLSTDFEFINRRSTPSIELRVRKDKWSAGFEAAYVFRTLENSDALRPNLSLRRDFENLELDSNFRYNFSENVRLRTNYSLRNSPPNISQLQPFQDVSDPLNITIGNTGLEPTNTHRVGLSFNTYNFQKGTGLFLSANASFINDRVIAQTTVDENFVRSTTYANVNGNRNGSINASYNQTVKIDTLRTFKYRVGLSGSSSRTINFNNGVQYASINNSLNPNLRLTFNIKDVLEIESNYRLSFQRTTFDIDDFENQEFLRHAVNLRTATFFPKGLEWRNTINYTFNPDVADGFDRSAIFWNSTLAYTFLKDKATLTLKVYDLLNQNTNARRTATANFIQDSQSTVLQQYFLLSFSWKFNTLGSKGETRNNSFFIF